jgi:hypothetical protein
LFGVAAAMVGACFSANFQSMAVNFYSASYSLIKEGLNIYEILYTTNFLKALSCIEPPPEWAVSALCAVPIVAILANQGEKIKISDLMDPDALKKFKKELRHLPWGQQSGKVGEELAAAWLKQQGFTNVVALQNASNQGIDIIGMKNAKVYVFEVKSHILIGIPTLSSRQAEGPTRYAKNILDDIAHAPAWRNISPEVSRTANFLLNYITNHNNRISGYVINVNYALSTKVLINATRWTRLRR